MNPTERRTEKSPRAPVTSFANVVGAGLVILLTVLPFVIKHHLRLWPLGVAAGLAVWARVSPRTLRPVESAWMKIGAALGWVNSRIILTAVYFLMITPMGLCARLYGSLVECIGARTGRAKDARAFSGFDPSAPSYRITSRPTGGREGMERPF